MLRDQIIEDQSSSSSVRRYSTPRSGIPVNSSAGFTLIELIISIAIVAVLVSLVIPTYADFVSKAKNGRAMQEIRVLETEIQGFAFVYSAFPDSLAEINRSDLKDPWGQIYVYNNFSNIGLNPPRSRFGVDLNADFDIYSKGNDRLTDPVVSSATGKDDVVRGGDGLFVGLGEDW